MYGFAYDSVGAASTDNCRQEVGRSGYVRVCAITAVYGRWVIGILHSRFSIPSQKEDGLSLAACREWRMPLLNEVCPCRIVAAISAVCQHNPLCDLPLN